MNEQNYSAKEWEMWHSSLKPEGLASKLQKFVRRSKNKSDAVTVNIFLLITAIDWLLVI